MDGSDHMKELRYQDYKNKRKAEENEKYSVVILMISYLWGYAS